MSPYNHPMGLPFDILRAFELAREAETGMPQPQKIQSPLHTSQGTVPGPDGPFPPPVAPTETDVAMMRRALVLAAHAASLGEVPVGALVYETATGTVLAEAHNRRELDNDPAAHAEFLAMREACRVRGDWRLADCTLVVTLEPCPMCAGLVVNARVGRLVYGAPDPKAGACRSLMSLTTDPRLNHRVEPVPGVLADESASLLRAFFASLRRPDRPAKPEAPPA